jgi:hypothetical protein
MPNDSSSIPLPKCGLPVPGLAGGERAGKIKEEPFYKS